MKSTNSIVITKEQVAEICQIEPKTVQWLTRSRQIPFCKIGRQIRYMQEDILQWLQRQKVKAI